MRCNKAVVGGISKLGMMQTEGNVAFGTVSLDQKCLLIRADLAAKKFISE